MTFPDPQSASTSGAAHGTAAPPGASAEAYLYLDPEEARAAKVVRDHRYNTVTVPKLRAFGLVVGAVLIAVHNALVPDTPPASACGGYLLATLPYIALSWLALRRWYGRTGWLHLGDAFLLLDLPFMALIVHATGGEYSLLAPLAFIRVVDQAFYSFRRCLLALHLAPVVLVATFAWPELVGEREVDWALGATKILSGYAAFCYIAFISRTSERVRQRLRETVQLGRRFASELKQVSTEAVRAKEQAEEALRMRSAFLANLSHDVRTPLAGILGGVDLAQERTDDPELTDLLGVVHGSAESLLHCLNDLLDLSKIEAGSLQLDDEPFDLEERLGAVLRGQMPTAEAKGLALNVSFGPNLPAVIWGDRLRFGQIMTHLVGNAIKFTDAGEVAIDVSRASDDRLVEIAIRDTGRGIPEGQLEGIFGAFFQVDGDQARCHGGKGIGLSLSRELARAMAGDIVVSSSDGHGSLFRLRLPIGLNAPEQVVGGALAGLRLAVVSEDPKLCEGLADTLLRAEATLVAADGDPDVVLVDAHATADLAAAIPADVRERTVLVLSSTAGSLAPESLADRPRIRMPLLPRHLARLVHELRAVDPDSRRADDPEPPRGRRVLLVEDNPVNRRLALHHLRRWGHLVTVAEDGVDAVRTWAPGRFDVILMDVQMPRMDGIEATRRIRELEGPGDRTLIFAVTANALRDDVERSHDAGMDRHLSKPVDFDALRGMLEQLEPPSPTERRSSVA